MSILNPVGRRLGSVRISLWVWPVLALLATAAAGVLRGPTAALLTIGGFGLLLAGMAIGVRLVSGRSERAAPSSAQPPPQSAPSPRNRTDLRGAQLAGANLVNADLRRADLRGADLSGADLRGANLQDAVLSPLDEG